MNTAKMTSFWLAALFPLLCTAQSNTDPIWDGYIKKGKAINQRFENDINTLNSTVVKQYELEKKRNQNNPDKIALIDEKLELMKNWKDEQLFTIATEAAMSPFGEIVIDACNFSEGTLAKNESGQYKDMITGRGSVTYLVPKIERGEYYISFLCAAQSERPVELFVNEKSVGKVLDIVTGSWSASSLKWFSYGPYKFKSSNNNIQLKGGGFPLIRSIKIHREPLN